MDLHSLYEMTQHFIVVSHMTPVLEEAWETASNVFTALTEKEAMSVSDRAYHVGKFSLATAGLIFSAATGSLAGAAGFAIPEAEEVRELNKIGRHYRQTHS